MFCQPSTYYPYILTFFLLGSVCSAQSTYVQGKINLQIYGNTHVFFNHFHSATNTGVYIKDASSVYIKGDSVSVLGQWNQDVGSKVTFYPPTNSAINANLLAFRVSKDVVFKNVSFEEITSTSGLLLRELVSHQVQFVGQFTFPNCPIFLGSMERATVKDYILDTNKYLILKAPDDISFNNITIDNYFITSCKSALQLNVRRGIATAFPVGYTRGMLSPVLILNSSASADDFTVNVSPWLYGWDTRFVSKGDTVNASNIKRNGVEQMWTVSATNNATTADISVQFPNTTKLFQPAYDTDSSMLIRYAGTSPNSLGGISSSTYWERLNAPSNESSTIYNFIPTNVVLKRYNITGLDKYNIFTASSFQTGDKYPLSAKLHAVIYDTVIYSSNSVVGNLLTWNLKQLPIGTSAFKIYGSKNPPTSTSGTNLIEIGEVVVDKTKNYYYYDIPSIIVKDTRLYYKIVPIPENETDSNLYIYNPYIKDATSATATSNNAQLIFLNNPYPITQAGSVEAVIRPSKKNLRILSIAIGLFSPFSVGKELLKTMIDNPSSDQLNLSIDIQKYNLQRGHYVMVVNLKYENNEEEVLFNKFTIF